MKKVMIPCFIIYFLLYVMIPMYGAFDTEAFDTASRFPSRLLIQYTPDPTAVPTPTPVTTVDVTVIDFGTKEPLSGARVEIRYHDGFSTIGHTASTGKLSITYYSDRTITSVTVSKDGYDTLVAEEIGSGVFELSVTIPDPDNCYEVSGTVSRRDTGSPLEGVVIRLRSYHNEAWEYANTETGASGDYSLTAYTGKTAIILIGKTGYAPYSVEIEPGTHTIDVSLEPDLPGTGEVWVYPAGQTVPLYERFTIEIHANTGNRKLAAYGFHVRYNTNILSLNFGVGTDGVVAGPDGFVSATDANTPGDKIISGFDTTGTGPGEDIHIVTVNFIALATGTSDIDLIVNDIVDPFTFTIGTPAGTGGSVTVSTPALGDVNRDGRIGIVDALLVARCYVSGDTSILDTALADVNHDGRIDIVDALRIAQYDVGLISRF
ncbi:MAG: hypothetical protein JW881_17725 [Spirochaetales bacterium]|nr:hypothetical protein [Spirochaetales bacterium]